MTSNNSNPIDSAPNNVGFSAEISLKTEDVPQSEAKPLVVSKLTRKHTIRKSFRSEDGKKIYICYLDSCSRQFNHLSSLIKHERIHRNERPYVCSTCGQTFVQSSNLKRHEKSHTGEKPYKCKICPKRFSTACNLRQHAQVHQDGSGEVNYSCSKCGKVYIYTSSLIKHQKGCSKSNVKSESQQLPEIKIEETKIRKIVKTEETSSASKHSNKSKVQEGFESMHSSNSPQNFRTPENQIPSGLTNVVTSGNHSLNNQLFSPNLLPLSSTSYFSTYPNHNSSLNLSPQALYNLRPSASRAGFSFNNPSQLFPLQSMPTHPLFDPAFPSESIIQGVIERRILQENLQLRRSIQNCLFRNGQL